MVLGPRKSFQIGLFVFAHRTRLPNTDRRTCDMCSNSGPIMLLASYHGIKDRSSCNKNMATTTWNLIIDTMNGCGCVVTATSCHLQTELDSAADPLVQSNRISPKLRCNSYSIQPVTPPPYRGAEYCDERVCPPSLCVFICLSTIISLELHVGQTPIFTIFVHVTYGRGSVLLWRCSDKLCTSGYMDDVIFAHKPRLLDVAAQLKRSAHAALGWDIKCEQ